MYVPEDTYFILSIVTTVLHAIGMLSTLFRLWFRYRIHRLWWEDAWAAIALAFDVICLYSTWAPIYPWGTTASIVSGWFSSFSFTCVLWAARLSVLFSVLRMTTPSRKIRFLSFFTVLLFLGLWAGVLILKGYLCGDDLHWHTSDDELCYTVTLMIVFEVAADTVGDTILVALPITLFWNVKLPKKQRAMILTTFSSAILITIVSIIHAGFEFTRIYALIGALANLEAAFSLIVCNLLVVVTYIYRILRHGADMETDSTDTSESGAGGEGETGSGSVVITSSTQTQYLTTIDVDFSGYGSAPRSSWTPAQPSILSSNYNSDGDLGVVSEGANAAQATRSDVIERKSSPDIEKLSSHQSDV